MDSIGNLIYELTNHNATTIYVLDVEKYMHDKILLGLEQYTSIHYDSEALAASTLYT